MDFKDLCGNHIFQGIEISNKKHIGMYGDEEDVGVIKFMLDGITFEAMEDPDDGYRSYCSDIVISNEKPKYTFPDNRILCKMKPNDDYEHDVLMGINPNTGCVIFEIGTLYIDDYYPWLPFCISPRKSPIKLG